MTSCCTLCHRLCLKKWICIQEKFDFTFSLDSNLGGKSPPYNLNLILPIVTFGSLFFSKLKEWLVGLKFTSVRDFSKAIRYFRAQGYICFGVPVCSSDVAEAAITVCKGCRRLVEVLFTGYRFILLVTRLLGWPSYSVKKSDNSPNV